MSNKATIEQFRLLPIDWHAIGTIVTFLAVVISLVTLYFYKKRETEQIKREIGEKILEKLYSKLDEIKSYTKNCQLCVSSFISSWQELRKITIAYHKIFQHLRESFDKFEQLLKTKQILSEKREELKKTINYEIRKCLLAYCNKSSKFISLYEKDPQKFEEIKNKLTNEMSYLNIEAWSGIKGDISWIEIWDFFILAFKGITYAEYKKEVIQSFVKKGSEENDILERWKIGLSISGYDLSEYLDEDIFEIISKNIEESIEKNPKIKEFVMACRDIYNESLQLQFQICKFWTGSKKRKNY
jgi:uncharacterized membrane-anchored protein YhcB (DUF1043 family)